MVSRPRVALPLMAALTLSLTGCSPPESGAAGILVKDGAIHVVAHSCPGWIGSLLDPGSRDITTVSWQVQDPSGLRVAPEAWGSEEVGKPGTSIDLTIGQIHGSRLVLGRAAVTGEGNTLNVSARRQQNDINEFFARSVAATAEEVTALRADEVLMGGPDAASANRVVQEKDFASVACGD